MERIVLDRADDGVVDEVDSDDLRGLSQLACQLGILGARRRVARSHRQRPAHFVETRTDQAAGGDGTALLRQFTGLWRDALVSSDYTAGCVASNLGGELSSGNRAIGDAVTAVVQSWVEAIADGVAARYTTREAALACAATVMAALSGMRTMARAQHSTAMFPAVAEVLVKGLPDRRPDQ